MSRILHLLHVNLSALLLAMAHGDSLAQQASPKENPIAIGQRLELLVDEHLIESIQGEGALRLHRPEPREVVLVTDKPWEGNTSAYYSIFQDGDLYRMYYRGSHFDETLGKAAHREVTCYAESRDGIHWTKPELGLFEFGGSTKNNIVWDGIGTHCFTVFKDGNPDCPSEARYKAISRGRPKGKKGLYVFHSADGIRWSLIRDEPVITAGAFDSQNLAFWDGEAEIYREFHRTFHDGVRAIMTGTSKDFVTWSDPVLVSYRDAPKQHLYTNAVLPYARAPHFLVGFPTRFLPDQGERVEPTFMVSRDGGRTFHRWLDAVIPESAPKDRGGNRSNYMTWGVLTLPNRPNELSVFATEAYYTGPDSRVRRFSYRTDGFASFHARRAGGELTSKPLTFEGEFLYLNYAVEESGTLRVEVQDEQGNPIDGFSLSDCTPMRGDAIKEVVRWKGSTDLGRLAGTSIRLRFQLKGGDLYSFRFGGSDGAR